MNHLDALRDAINRCTISNAGGVRPSVISNHPYLMATRVHAPPAHPTLEIRYHDHWITQHQNITPLLRVAIVNPLTGMIEISRNRPFESWLFLLPGQNGDALAKVEELMPKGMPVLVSQLTARGYYVSSLIRNTADNSLMLMVGYTPVQAARVSGYGVVPVDARRSTDIRCVMPAEPSYRYHVEIYYGAYPVLFDRSFDIQDPTTPLRSGRIQLSAAVYELLSAIETYMPTFDTR
jgi:hypothetical protein